MRNLTVVGLLVVVALGCGRPACDDSGLESSNLHACASQGAPAVYCQCFVDHVFARYTCADVRGGNIPVSAVEEGCNACAPQSGGTCG